MARMYAGVMGTLAFSLTVFLGLLRGAGVEATLGGAIGALVAFAVLGGGVGYWAEWIVDDSLHWQWKAETAARDNASR